MTAVHSRAEWFRLVRRVRPIIEAQVQAHQAVCVDCGQPVLPGQRWQVGHRLDAATHPHLAYEDWNVGPSHGKRAGAKACNQQAGARLGNRMRADRSRRRRDNGGMGRW
ncbi:hypothetical protein LG314_07965 [Agrococcus terreus]|uniref:hypothetical protein n=1 Tax=Agrococcus terreus TaxID=574649 RepID=UPI0038506C0D